MSGILGHEPHHMSIEEMNGTVKNSHNSSKPVDEPETYHRIGVTGLTDMPASSKDPIPEEAVQKLWDITGSACPSPLIPRDFLRAGVAAFPSETQSAISQASNVEFCPYNSSGNDTSPSMNAENTPPSDASTPSMTQYAIRPNPNMDAFSGLDTKTFQVPVGLNSDYRPPPHFKGHHGGDTLDGFLEAQMWGLNG
jgi:hypothetical protein